MSKIFRAIKFCDNTGAAYKAPGPREFASGDYVKVELDEDAFSAALQSGNGFDTIEVTVIIIDTYWAE